MKSIHPHAKSATFLVIGLFILGMPTAWAHAPHDVVDIVEISPNFSADQTLFSLILLTDHALLARSTDAGRSWMEFGAPILWSYIRKISFSPSYAVDQTLFSATRENGIYRSTDGGLTWQTANTGLTTVRTYEVAIAPSFSNNGLALAATEKGLFRTTDGGDTWTKVTSGLIDIKITAICFVPGDPDTAYAGSNTIHRSTDGGLTWVNLHNFNDDMRTIAVSPAFQTDESMAVIFRNDDGVHGSSDAGQNWTPAHTGLTDLEVNDITFADDGTVFVVTKTNGCFRAASIFSSWSLHMDGFEVPSNQTTSHYRSVAASPDFSLDETVFVGSFEGFFKSTDRGETWKQSDLYNQRLCRQVTPSPDYGKDGLVFVGNYGGGPYVWQGWGSGHGLGPPHRGTGTKRASPAGHGAGRATASSADQPFPGAPFLPPPLKWDVRADQITSLYSSVLTLSPDFANDQTLFYGYMGLWRSTDSGKHWSLLNIPIDLPRAIALSPQFASDRIVFMGSGRVGTFVSNDAGDTWNEITGGLPSMIRSSWIRLSPMFPADPTLFISSTEDGVWRSQDAGATWSKASTGLLSENIRSLGISPDFVNDRLLIAGAVDEGLFRSDDAGNSWAPINNGLPSGSENIIESIAFSPDFAVDRTVFVASLFDGVFKSTDGGWNWQPAQNGLPPDAPREVALSPNYAKDQTVFLSTHFWIWRSKDGGDTWQRMPGYNRVNDTHPAVFREGNWRNYPQTECYLVSYLSSKETGAFTELEFRGDTLQWFGLKDAESGMAEIILDGDVVATVDLYSSTTLTQQLLYEETFGNTDWHSIRIRVTGTKNPLSADYFVKTDGFGFAF